MATSFPGGLDSFVNPGASDPQNSPGALNHATQHDNINDAVAAVETKVGINGSADTNSLDYKVNNGLTNIAGLTAANPSSVGNGWVFVPAGATSGTAINAAITSFGGTKGVVQLGKGTHTLDTAVVLADNVTIEGAGRSSTFLVFNPATFSPAMSAGTTPINRPTLSDFRIQSTTDGSGVALDLGYCNYAVVTRVDIGANNAYPNKGIDFSINNNTSRPYYNVIRDCYIAVGGASPIGIDLTNQANSNVVDNVRVDMPGATLSGVPVGVRIAGPVRASHTILIMHLDVESVATATGILISDSSYNINIVSPYFEAINKGIQIDAGTQNVQVTGFYCYNWGTNHILDNSGATGGGISVEGMATLASGAGTAFPFNYRSATAPLVFAASGTLTKAQTYGASAIRIRGCNGGSGAGGAAATAAATVAVGTAGAGGPSAEKTVPLNGLTFPLQVTVGAAGAGGTAGANNGSVGGQSIVKDNNGAGATLWTPGASSASSVGIGGAASGTPGILGSGFVGAGTTPVADLAIPGSIPGDGIRISTTLAYGPGGGDSSFGNGGFRGNNTTGGGVGVGGGGGSTVLQASQAATAGAPGGTGIVIIELVF